MYCSLYYVACQTKECRSFPCSLADRDDEISSGSARPCIVYTAVQYATVVTSIFVAQRCSLDVAHLVVRVASSVACALCTRQRFLYDSPTRRGRLARGLTRVVCLFVHCLFLNRDPSPPPAPSPRDRTGIVCTAASKYFHVRPLRSH